MGRGDFGFDGVHSLDAVNEWIAVINANLSATGRIGYKGSKVKMAGTTTEVLRNPVGTIGGIQIPESSIKVDQTNIDFSQGSIINSTEETHLALRGRGFFRMTNATPTQGNPALNQEFFSRDGEFHLANYPGYTEPILVNSAGLYLVENTPAAVSLTGVAAGTVSLQAFIQNSFGDNIYDAITPQFLTFSRYGATIFEDRAYNQTGNAAAAITKDQATLGASPTPMIKNSLETSNTSLSQSLPELSLAQKFFSAVSKVVSVHQTNLDTILNIIR